MYRETCAEGISTQHGVRKKARKRTTFKVGTTVEKRHGSPRQNLGTESSGSFKIN